MSDSFNIAAFVPVARDGFEAWVNESPQSPTTTLPFQSMYRGWYWEKTQVVDPPERLKSATVGAFLRAGIGDENTLRVVRHIDGALNFFDCVALGPAHQHTLCTLSVLSQLSAHMVDGAVGHVVYWAEIGGALPDRDGVISFLEVAASGSRFLTHSDLTKPRGAFSKVMKRLVPAESLFGELLDAALGEGSYTNAEALRSERFVEPMVLGETR